MRILIATSHRSVVGGVETYVRELLPALAQRGHDLALLHEYPAADGAAVDALAPALPRWCAQEGLQQAAQWRPDVVYLHGLESPDLEEALLQSYPSFFFGHNYHGTCISGTKRFAWPGAQPCERTLGAGCLLHYLPRRCGGLHPATMLQQYALQRRRHELLTRYRGVLVASRHMQEEYRRHGVAADRLHLVPLFPPEIERDPEPPDARPFNHRILMVGRLTPLKGGRLLLGALALAQEKLGRPLELVIAGDGPERSLLEAQARTKKLLVRFTGWVDAPQRAQLMRTADVLAVPSLWPEPFGLVGIEAACVGLPAVAFAVGGIPDWLLPGISGESASATLTEANFAQALVRALSDTHHWARLRRGAWETAGRFSRRQHLDQLEVIFAPRNPALVYRSPVPTLRGEP